MKLYLGVGAVFVGAAAMLALGACGDDTTSTGTTGNSSTSSSSSGTSGMTSTSSSSSGTSGMTSTSSSGSSGMTSSSSSGSGVYEFCTDCTSNTKGAYTKECKAETDACVGGKDPECKKLADCSYDTCTTDAAGGCCTLKCATTLNTPMASQMKFYAMDNCVYCKTCTKLCDPEATAYCKVTAMGASAMCP